MSVQKDIDGGAKRGPAARLLEVADRLFYEHGFAATGIGELIKEAGVARSSFYQHFPSKEDLVVAYLNQRHEVFFEMLTAEIEEHQDPLDRVFAVFDCLAAGMEASSFRGCAFMNAVAEFYDEESAPRQVILKTKAALRGFVTRLCEEAGHPDAGDELYMLVEGASATSTVMRALWPVAAARRMAVHRLKSRSSEENTNAEAILEPVH